ncbi:MAG TPA: polysaccharide deacetylase family protein [Rhodocyclaceae bacterium]|nr:polysaccharide deacetylase family protein [Rhodocyclaceae bacterium]
MTDFALHTRLALAAIRVAGNVLPRSGGVCILNYHRVLPAPDPLLDQDPDLATFRWQMHLLARYFNVLPLHEAVAALASGKIPPRAVSITFDDGYRSTHDLALPILQEFGLPATVFVTSGYVGKANMWNDRIVEAVRNFPGECIDLQAHGLGLLPCTTLTERQQAAKLLTRAAKYLPQAAREALAQTLEPAAGSTQRQALMLTPAMLSWLVECGIEIGAHTVSHPILSKVDDDSALREMRESKQQLEEITGQPVRFFAYPNGKAGIDFDERHMNMAKELGFSAAFASSTNAATRRHDPYQIPRCHPWDATPAMFGLRLLRWLARS